MRPRVGKSIISMVIEDYTIEKAGEPIKYKGTNAKQHIPAMWDAKSNGMFRAGTPLSENSLLLLYSLASQVKANRKQ